MRTTKGHNRSNEKARNAANAPYSQIANAERRPFAPYDLAIARRTHARLEHEFSRAQHYIYRLQSSASVGDIEDLAPNSAMTASKDNSTVLQRPTGWAATAIKRRTLALRRLLRRSIVSSEPRPSERRCFHFVLVQSVSAPLNPDKISNALRFAILASL